MSPDDTYILAANRPKVIAAFLLVLAAPIALVVGACALFFRLF